MHCIELARLAALVAAQGPSVLLVRPQLPAEAMVQYWSAARQRFDLWNCGLRRLADLESQGRSLAAGHWWHQHTAMIQEILVSEILTRVMAAVGAGLDANHREGDWEPITQSVFNTHLEARNRVLRLLLFARGGSADQVVRLNRLRRCAEHWTDFLLGPLSGAHPEVLPFTHDAGRARSFAEEVPAVSCTGQAAAANALAVATMAASLAPRTDPRPALPEANRQLAHAVLACLPVDLFDSHGLLKSGKMQRLQRNHGPDCRPGRTPDAHHLLLHPHHGRPDVPQLVRWTL